ncbi:MAG: RNA polymerase sigma factor [Pyrinomonadaceae bacterium]
MRRHMISPGQTTNNLRTDSPALALMDISRLKTELEKLHNASFGWALSCCRHNRADAEEVLQIVYLKILEGRAQFRGDSRLQTWLFSVIRNSAVTERRKSLLRSMILTRAKTENQPAHEVQRGIERSEAQKRFQLALRKLPARQRETLHLVFYQDLSLREAANVMGISIGSARRHYERGKSRLREELDSEDVEYGLGWRRSENSGVIL